MMKKFKLRHLAVAVAGVLLLASHALFAGPQNQPQPVPDGSISTRTLGLSRYNYSSFPTPTDGRIAEASNYNRGWYVDNNSVWHPVAGTTDWSPEDFGGLADGNTDNTAAWNAMMIAMASGPSGPSSNVGGRIKLRCGTYFTSTGFHVSQLVVIEGTTGAGQSPCTKIEVAPGYTGITVDRATTSPNGFAGDWSVIRDLAVVPSVTTPYWQASHAYAAGAVIDPNNAVYDAWQMLVQASGPTVAGAEPNNYYGHYSMVAQNSGTSGSSQPFPSVSGDIFNFNSALEGTEVNDSGVTWKYQMAAGIRMRARAKVQDVYVSGVGTDGIAMTCDHTWSPSTNCNGWAIDYSRLNFMNGDGVFVVGQDANAGHANDVDVGGQLQWAIDDQSFLGDTYTACQSDSSGAGSFHTTSIDAENNFYGCYAEDRNYGTWLLSSPSSSWGSIGGGSKTGDSGFYASWAQFTPFQVNNTPTDQNSYSRVNIGENDSANAIMEYSALSGPPGVGNPIINSILRMVFNQQSNEQYAGSWLFNLANLNSWVPLVIPTAVQTTYGFGASGAYGATTIASPIIIEGMYLNNNVAVFSGSAAPTVNTDKFASGSFEINTAPTVQGTTGSQYVTMGWQNVSTGTPGTWVPLDVPIQPAVGPSGPSGAVGPTGPSGPTGPVPNYVALSVSPYTVSVGNNTPSPTGVNNTALGNNAGGDVSTGSNNTAVGASALGLLTSGILNTAIGNDSGLALGTGSSNTYIGPVSAGSATEHNTIRVSAGGAEVNLYVGNLLDITSAATSISGVYNVQNQASLGPQTRFDTVCISTTGVLQDCGIAPRVDSGSADVTFLGFGIGTGGNTVGPGSTVIGYDADNSDGSSVGLNVVIGKQAAFENLWGSANVIMGVAASYNSNAGGVTGGSNVFIGTSVAVDYGTTGSWNVGIGDHAFTNYSGSQSIAIGQHAGYNLTTGGNNIMLANTGIAGASNTISLCQGAGACSGVEQNAYMGGIYGQAEAGTGIAVDVDANGKLGTVVSARRFKDDIKSMGDVSATIAALRPVTYHYKSDAEKTQHWGLIAEEVETVDPRLVVYDNNHKIMSVRYQDLYSIGLAEIQRLQTQNKASQQDIADARAEAKRLIARIETLERIVDKRSKGVSK